MDRPLAPKRSPLVPRTRPARVASPGPRRGPDLGDAAPLQRGRSRTPSSAARSGASPSSSPKNRLHGRSVSLGDLSRSPALAHRVSSLAREVVGPRPGRSQGKGRTNGQAKGPVAGSKGPSAMQLSEKDRKIATLMLAKHAEREIEEEVRSRAQLAWDAERKERAEERARPSAPWLLPASPLLPRSFPPTSSASPGLPRRAPREARNAASSLGRELSERLKLLEKAEASRSGSVSSSHSHSSPPEILEIVQEEDEELEDDDECECEIELEAVGRRARYWLSSGNGNGSWEFPMWEPGSPGRYPQAVSPAERAFAQAWRIQRARIAARQQTEQTMERHRLLLQETEERTQRAARVAQEQVRLRADIAEQRRLDREAQHRSALLRLAELEEQRRRAHEEAAARAHHAGLRAVREREAARDAARALARAACRVRERVREAVTARSFHRVARDAEAGARALRPAPPPRW